MTVCDYCGETREPCSCCIDDYRGVHGQDDYYDDFFQNDIKRSENIMWLSNEDRIKYRREKFNIDANTNSSK